jgi:hypothetical protein
VVLLLGWLSRVSTSSETVDPLADFALEP